MSEWNSFRIVDVSLTRSALNGFLAFATFGQLLLSAKVATYELKSGRLIIK